MSEYVVMPDSDGWRVALGTVPQGHFATKEEALAAALLAARANRSRVHLARVKTPTRDFVFLD